VDGYGYVGWFTSIALDFLDKPHISYYDSVDQDLKYTTNAEGSWSTTIVDSVGNVGEFTSIALDSANQAHISYFDVTNSDLKYATDAGGLWSNITLDSDGNVGSYTSIALDSTDRIHISYHDSSNHDAKYAAEVTEPSAPLDLQAIAGDALVTLNWSPPSSDGGSPVVSYNILRGTTPGGEEVNTTVLNVLTYTNAGLTNGVTYYFKVCAVNSVGPGPSSNEASATPIASISVPTAPQNLQATAGDGYIGLAWQAPSSNGGSPIINYRIYDTSSNMSILIATLGNVSSHTVDSLNNGQTYYYHVRAANSVGEGPSSNEVSATPNPPAIAPSAPQNLAANAGNAQINLAWSAPRLTGSSAITGYRIYRGTNSGGESFLVTLDNVLTYTDSGLTNGQVYYYKISAMNSAGEGALADEVNATPSAPIPDDGDNLTLIVAAVVAIALAGMGSALLLQMRKKK
jgi:hypothetical protein